MCFFPEGLCQIWEVSAQSVQENVLIVQIIRTSFHFI